MRKAHIVLILTMAAVLIAPSAMAVHFTVTRADRDARDLGGPGALWHGMSRWNDDGSDVMPAGAVGGGLDERLHVIGGTPGDGNTLVFDSRYLPMAGVLGAPTDEFTGLVSEGNRIMPGLGSFFAWYGIWNDLTGDGIIDDYKADDFANTARDEFFWHGIADGNEGLNMLAWAYPSNPDVGCSTPVAPINTCRDVDSFAEPNAGLRTLGALENPGRSRADFAFADRTNVESDELWLAGNGFMTTFIDDGLIMTTTVMSIANAQPLAGSAAGFDLDPANPAPDMLRDIDSFESVSPELEALYLSAVAPARGAYLGTLATVYPIAGNGEAATHFYRGPVDDLYSPGQAFDGQTCATCDFATGWSPFLDMQADIVIPVSKVWYPATPAGPANSAGIWGFQGTGVSPTTAEGEDRTAIGGLLIAATNTGYFYDANGDGFVGNACRYEEGYSGSGPCSQPYRWGATDDPNTYAQTHDDGSVNEEFIADCSVATPPIRVTVSPVGSDWAAGTLFVPFYNQVLGNYAVDGDIMPAYPLTGTEAASLRMEPAACDGQTSPSYTKDAVFLPGGTQLHAIQVSVTVHFRAYTDASRGISIAPADITDVDMIVPASL